MVCMYCLCEPYQIIFNMVWFAYIVHAYQRCGVHVYQPYHIACTYLVWFACFVYAWILVKLYMHRCWYTVYACIVYASHVLSMHVLYMHGIDLVWIAGLSTHMHSKYFRLPCMLYLARCFQPVLKVLFYEMHAS